MSTTTQPNPVNDVLRELKENIATPELWEEFATWGETHEQVMKDNAEKEWNYHMYDLVMTAMPSTAQQIEEGTWVAGILFTVVHEYMDKEETILGKSSDSVFLPYNEEGKLAALLPVTLLTEITPDVTRH